jgi:benzoyl-CoA reductase/2-hydroxyglutaryl-CoA dehydratase subunit BcrC/BadD/HgdB
MMQEKKMSRCCSGNTDNLSATRFDRMIANCYEYAATAKASGRPIVGILCEYTPREIILAAGGVPVCLCGGSEEKIAPAEQDLPAGLCPLIKSTYGYYHTQTNPFLEMADVIVAETTCDGKKKMYELMGRDKEMYILELPQKPDDPHAQEHWLWELRKFRDFLQTRFGKVITNDDLRNATAVMNRERDLRRRLAQMNTGQAAAWSGRQLLDFKSIISGIPEDMEEYERLINTGGSHACQAMSKPRVLLTGVPTVHGAEKVVDLIEQAGAQVVCMENCTGVKPILEDVCLNGGDPLEAIAEKYFHLPCSVMTRNRGRMDLLKELAAAYRADCIIDLVWQGCLTYDVESYFVKQAAEEMGLAYLKIVTDYSPSDSARIALRIEALLETAKQA